MTIAGIENGEQGLSVRTKLNAVINAVNVGGKVTADTLANIEVAIPATAGYSLVVVTDADSPTAGSVVVGEGSETCVAISNGTDYIVVFVLP